MVNNYRKCFTLSSLPAAMHRFPFSCTYVKSISGAIPPRNGKLANTYSKGVKVHSWKQLRRDGDFDEFVTMVFQVYQHLWASYIMLVQPKR